jgi:hypothetical protein
VRRRSVLLVTPPAVVAVAVAGFVGYGAWSRSKPVHYSRGGPFVASDPASPSSGTSQTATPKASGSPIPGAVASAVPSATRSPMTTASPIAPAKASRGHGPSTTTRTDVRSVPVAGTYRVAVSGSEQVRFGPVSFCSRDFPGASAWNVHPADGEGPSAFAVDQRYFPGQDGQHDERHLYRYVEGEVHLEFEQATVTCAGQRQSSDVTFSPPQLRIRSPLTVGAHWSSTGGDAQRTETASTRVLRAETLTVSGRRIPTYVVETKVQISGSESGNRTQRWWWAPSLALPVRVFEEISAQRSGGQYTSSAATTVTALPAGA